MHARVEGGGGRRYNLHIIIVYLWFHRSWLSMVLVKIGQHLSGVAVKMHCGPILGAYYRHQGWHEVPACSR